MDALFGHYYQGYVPKASSNCLLTYRQGLGVPELGKGGQVARHYHSKCRTRIVHWSLGLSQDNPNDARWLNGVPRSTYGLLRWGDIGSACRCHSATRVQMLPGYLYEQDLRIGLVKFGRRGSSYRT